MAKLARLSDGTTLRFPDGTDQAVIDEAVKKHLAKGRLDMAKGFWHQFHAGIQDSPINIGEFLTMASGDEEAQQEIADYKAEREQRLDDRSGGAPTWPRTVGQVMSTGFTGAGPARGGSFATRTAENVANVAAESAGMSVLAGDPSTAGQDAVTGAGIQAGFDLLPRWMRNSFNMAQDARQKVAKSMPMDEGAREADAFAESRGVPIAGEDLIRNQMVRSSGRALDSLDPTGFRSRQLDKMRRGFEDEVVDPFRVVENPSQVMEESFARQYQAVETRKRELYEEAWNQTDQLGDVPMGNFREQLAALKKETDRVLGEGSKESRTIDRWIEYSDGSVRDWDARRKKLGRDIRKAERASDPDTVDYQTLKDIRRALDEEVDTFAGKNSAYRQAQEFYKDQVVPYKEQAFKKQIKRGDLEKAVNDALSGAPTKQTRAHFEQVWGSLDEAGKEAYRQSMLEQVMEKATNPETGFSPDQAATMLDRLSNRLGPEVLGPEINRAMKGWNNLFRQSGFAAELVARSRTGSSAVQVGSAALALLNPQVFTLFLPGVLARSRRARQILAKLADMSPQHKDYQAVYEDALQVLSQEMAKSAAAATENE